jgi:uncharacterized protein YkwD
MKKLIAILFLSFGIQAFSQTSQELELIRLTNIERAKEKRSPVTYSSLLDSAAKFHNRYQVAKGKIDHIEYEIQPGETLVYEGPMQRIEKFNSKWLNIFTGAVGEICAGHFETNTDNKITEDSAVQMIFSQWMKSKGHRAILMTKDITHIAFALSIKKDPKTKSWAFYGVGLVANTF